MDVEAIKQKLQQAILINSELPDLELKQARNQVPDGIWKSISAFSQIEGGGLIILGVKEAPVEIVGCNNIQQMLTGLNEFFNNKMSFVLQPKYHVEEIDGKTILAVHVPECPEEHKPCYFKPVGLPDGAYIRDGIRNRKLTDNEFRTLIANSRQFRFDQSEALNATREDLSIDKIKALLERKEVELKRGAITEVNDDILKNIGVIKDFNSVLKPTVAGYLIFSKLIPQNKYPYERYTIRCVKYSGSSVSSDIIDKADITGTLDNQIDECYKFVLKNIRKTAFIEGTKRQEKYEYPEQAIRELIANAIIHRDYSILETFTHINLFDDRIEIANPGNLAPVVTIDNIRSAQFSRNLIIAQRLKDLDYLEEYGRGIDIVFNTMSQWGLQPPLFRNSVNSFQVILLGDKYKKISERQRQIIFNLLSKDKLTINQLLKLIKVPKVTLNKDLKSLKELGIIKQLGASVSTCYTLSI